METIKLSKDQYQFILVIIKFLSQKKEKISVEGNFIIPKTDLKKFMLRNLITMIEIKNNLLANFDNLLESMVNRVYVYDKKNDQLHLSKVKMCSIVKPILSKALVNPNDRKFLSDFFKQFECNHNEEFILELI